MLKGGLSCLRGICHVKGYLMSKGGSVMLKGGLCV